MVAVKSDREIDLMRRAGRMLGQVFESLEPRIKVGISTKELDTIAEVVIRSLGGKPAFLDYKGFPGSICASINEVIVHGIPGDRVLIDGDIIGLDIGVEFQGYYSDAAATFAVGNISDTAGRLMKVTEASLYLGIDKARPGNRISDIGHAIQTCVEDENFSVVRAFVGHGIGSSVHEEPEIPNFGPPNAGIKLEAGMTLAIEPMVNEGTHLVSILEDGWTAVTRDGGLSAHFEHTVLVTKKEPEILTKWQKKNRL